MTESREERRERSGSKRRSILRQKQQTKERNDEEKFSSLASLLLLSCFSLASLLLLCCFLHFFLLPSLLLRSFLFQIQLSSPLVLQRLLIFCLSLSLTQERQDSTTNSISRPTTRTSRISWRTRTTMAFSASSTRERSCAEISVVTK